MAGMGHSVPEEQGQEEDGAIIHPSMTWAAPCCVFAIFMEGRRRTREEGRR